jgi:class 3 adenylate cyclase/pimeloyl-ACP methyl ester carboxylesterase
MRSFTAVPYALRVADQPVTRYVKTSDDVHIAYQVFGSGPDLLYCMGLWWHIDYQWEIPNFRRQLEHLGSFRRVISFDKRGTGLSDRVPPDRLPTLGARLEDLNAVLDAVGSERTAVLGHSHAADLAIAFAATHPDRTEALVLVDGYAKLVRSDDHPWGLAEAEALAALERMEHHWDEPQGYGRMDGDARAHDRWMTMQRLAVSPGAAMTLWQMALQSDVRELLHQIRAPTLVLHSHPNRLVDVGCGRYLAASIPNAKLKLLPPRTVVFGDGDDDVVAIEEFLTGRPSTAAVGRVLMTVLFTDIVDSTVRASRLGDRRWRELLDEHDQIVDRALERNSGRKINPTGDGVLATFDAPGRAIRCAIEIRDELASIDVHIRAGVHTGEVELRGNDVGGIAVNICARISALAGAGQILVTRTVTDLVAGSGIVFDEGGEYELRGVPGNWKVYLVKP